MRNRFDRQLQVLNDELIEMGSLIEQAIEMACSALVRQDVEKAQKAISFDEEIDHQERDIESLCMKLLLQQQPVAKDLRLISAALKMITDMERIGDHATDISEITIQLADQRARLPVVGDVGGVLRKDVAHELVDGVIALLLQRGVHARQDVVDLLVLFLRGVEFAGIVFHSVSPPSTCQYTPIFCKVKGFWASVTKP